MVASGWIEGLAYLIDLGLPLANFIEEVARDMSSELPTLGALAKLAGLKGVQCNLPPTLIPFYKEGLQELKEYQCMRTANFVNFNLPDSIRPVISLITSYETVENSYVDLTMSAWRRASRVQLKFNPNTQALSPILSSPIPYNKSNPRTEVINYYGITFFHLIPEGTLKRNLEKYEEKNKRKRRSTDEVSLSKGRNQYSDLSPDLSLGMG
jgi:hypothetical protein